MEQQNISITPELLAHAKERVASGEFANVSDYMRALVRRDRQEQQLGIKLVALLAEAEASGEPVEMTPEQVGQLMQQHLAEKADEPQPDRKAG